MPLSVRQMEKLLRVWLLIVGAVRVTDTGVQTTRCP
jgi:hypothetical protein